ncbi:unnamed protein product [Paramecium octaurelia]|uniref:Transmembrane protein n=1 Tax=Paramecium octaurelia TaxID=43137 RepID=A0A8S1T1V1_PAROT|nr:unnamed protein product [Paramecium octaurelia]
MDYLVQIIIVLLNNLIIYCYLFLFKALINNNQFVIMLKYQKSNISSYRAFFNALQMQCDIFGQLPMFTILKKERFSTSFGAFSTLIIFGFCLLYLWIELEKLFNRSDPNVIQYDSQLLESSEIPLMNNNFTIAVTLSGLNTQPFKNVKRYFNISVNTCKRQRVFNKTDNTTQVIQQCQEYPIEACTVNHAVTDSQKEYFGKLQLGTVQCLQNEAWQANPPKLQGVLQAMEFQYLQIQVQICHNTTTYNECAPLEEIQDLARAGYYGIHLSDNLLQLNEFEQPFSQIQSMQQASFSLKTSRSIYQTLKQVQIITDDGFVQENRNSFFGLIQNQWREESSTYNNIFLINHFIYLDGKQSTYQRNYIKIQAILGKIGGFWNVAVLLFKIFVTPIVITLMNVHLVNKLFRFEINERSQLFKDEIKEESLSDINKSQTIYKEPSQQQYDVVNSNQKRKKPNKLQSNRRNQSEIQKYLTQSKQQLNLGIIDILLVAFCCKRKVKQQIRYAKTKCQHKLDVALIISKIYEFDKLKYVLFSNEQLNIFNCIPKPIIPADLFNRNVSDKMKALEQQKQYLFMLEDEMPMKLKLEQAFSSYKKLKNKKDKTYTDHQLLDFLDDDLVNLFENLSKNEDIIAKVNDDLSSVSNRDKLNSASLSRQLNVQLDISQISQY